MPAATDTWQNHDFSADDRTARAGHTATAVGKYIYIIGGRRGCVLRGSAEVGVLVHM